MSTIRLLLCGLVYFWRTNLAVLLGVLAGTAVIAGALVVGDSVRASLRQMTLDRLGDIDHALFTQRFFREDLAAELADSPAVRSRFQQVAPALVMSAALESREADTTHRVNKVQLYGVDEGLWELVDHPGLETPTDREIIVNQRIAEELSLVAGDEVTAWVEMPSNVPRDSLLGERDGASREVVFTVKAVLDAAHGAGRLGLYPNQQLPRVAYVALGALQASAGLERVRPSRQLPAGKPPRVNSLFAQARSEQDGGTTAALDAAETLTSSLSQTLTLPDLGLRLQTNAEFGYLSLESEQQILADTFADHAGQAAQRLGMSVSPVLAYVANELANAERPGSYSMYSIVAGIDFETLSAAPFGPMTYVGPAPGVLKSDELVVNDWLARDLDVAVGDRVTLKYHTVGSHGELPEIERTFIVRGILRLEGTPAADPGLVPEVEGITDSESLQDWEQPFPMQLDRLTERDEEYWDRYRTTPKAFLSLEAAQQLWRSRYGSLTSVRLSPLPHRTLEESARELTAALLQSISPSESGFVFQPVKYLGLEAAAGTTDFSGLFVGFSFFIILSATILIGLLFRLGIERRTAGVGLLSAVGFTPRRVRRLFVAEGLLVVLIGGAAGVPAAVGYAWLMVYGLRTWWRAAVGTQFLHVYPQWSSLLAGFAISLAVTAAAIWWGMRQLRKLSIRAMLAGHTDVDATGEAKLRRKRRSSRAVAVSLTISLLLVAGSLLGLVPSTEAGGGLSWRTVAFFVVGIAMLAASLSTLASWLDADRTFAVRGGGLPAMQRLGIRNACRSRARSVLTTGMIASATFVIVAVAAGHRNPAAETPDRNSGNGGFTLVAETSQPLLYDLNTQSGREQLGIAPPPPSDDRPQDPSWLEQMQVIGFRVRPGEDASCLNIYQTRMPTILGVPREMIDRGGFKFAETKGDNPWTLLREPQDDGSIPVLGDMNTLLYSLHKGVGDKLAGPDGQTPAYTLKIVGMLDGSVFQGVLLMSEENFVSLFPGHSGYQYFLIETPPADAPPLSMLLETELAEYGFDAEPVVRRLADFLAVQNTYLSTFQTLGGLGLLLGSLGLATVMVRNVLERRSELALLRAVGFRNGRIAWMVLWENAFLLAWGLVSGTAAALLAMTPHLTSIGADVPWMSTAAILAGVFLTGTLTGLVAVYEAVRMPVLAVLRSE